MELHFSKYQGAGNDFILIDHRNSPLELTTLQIKHLCDRRFGIGADGLMLLNKHADLDFEMNYFNADGKNGSMCGNGGRCIVQFAKDLNIITNQTQFMASDGLHTAEILAKGIRLGMQDVSTIQQVEQAFVLNTGSPHYVTYIQNITEFDVFNAGKNIRNSPKYLNDGINVNFVEDFETYLSVRTYERGVEDETFACGTGATAVALCHAYKNQLFGNQNIHIKVLGGDLNIQFNFQAPHSFTDIWLSGPAEKVFEGKYLIND